MNELSAAKTTGGGGRVGGWVGGWVGRWAVAVLFVGSGSAALIYELVWYQLLRYVVGASSVSLSMTLASFMFGLGLGAWSAPKLIGERRHPLRVYAWLELAIGVLGLVLYAGIPWLGWVYAEVIGGGVLWRGAVCAAALVPPAFLMGATLPAVARWVSADRAGAAWLGGYYALNTLGATAGVLAGGFWLLPTLTLGQVSWVAAGLNVAVAIWAWGMAWGERWGERWDGGGVLAAETEAESEGISEPAEVAGRGATGWRYRWGIYGGVLGSGVVAMGCQVLWTRLLSAVLSVTVYAFSIILAVFLLGLAVGGAIGSGLAGRTRRPGFWLAVAQGLSLPAVAWAFWAVGHQTPDWPRYGGLGGWLRGTLAWWGVFGTGEFWRFLMDVERVAWALGPATLCWGASVPLALAAGWSSGERGRQVGRIYAWNTAGAIVGALAVGLWLMPWLGSAWSGRGLGFLAGFNAVWLWWCVRGFEPGSGLVGGVGWRKKMKVSEAWVGLLGVGRRGLDGLQSAAGGVWWGLRLGLVALGLGVVWWTPGVPEAVLVSGRDWFRPMAKVQLVEGLHATSAVTEDEEGVREMWVSGKVVASSLTIDMRLQRMLGHLAVLAHGGEPRSVLIVGLGTGTTAGCFVDYPSIERIVVCEIEPTVVELARTRFAEENRFVLDDPRTVVVADDARHFLATTDERFDIITSDPIHPWVRGAAALYSEDYYELVKRHLSEGGVVTHWLPFYESSDAAARSMLATFFDAFPGGTLWHAGDLGSGNDAVMLGRPDAPAMDLDGWVEAWPGLPALVVTAWSEVEVDRPASLFRRFLADAVGLKAWLADAARNRDSALRLEYLAGMSRWTGDTATDLHGPLMERRAWPAVLGLSAERLAEVEALWTAEVDAAAAAHRVQNSDLMDAMGAPVEVPGGPADAVAEPEVDKAKPTE